VVTTWLDANQLIALILVWSVLGTSSSGQLAPKMSDSGHKYEINLLKVLTASSESDLVQVVGEGKDKTILPDNIAAIKHVSVSYEWGYLGYSLVDNRKVGVIRVVYRFKTQPLSAEDALAKTNLSSFGKPTRVKHATHIWEGVLISDRSYSAKLDPEMKSIIVYGLSALPDEPK